MSSGDPVFFCVLKLNRLSRNGGVVSYTTYDPVSKECLSLSDSGVTFIGSGNSNSGGWLSPVVPESLPRFLRRFRGSVCLGSLLLPGTSILGNAKFSDSPLSVSCGCLAIALWSDPLESSLGVLDI